MRGELKFEICAYIQAEKMNAKAMGKAFIVLRAGDIHKDMKFVNRMPSVCDAMRACMSTGDIVLFEPPKGRSSTVQIKYYL